MTIEQMLSAARSRLRRLSPDEASEAVANKGAVLVDIRPESQRLIEGGIPGALIVERNVLEWRLDPASSSRLPIATHHDLRVIVFRSEGYTSSLAAAALQDLGLREVNSRHLVCLAAGSTIALSGGLHWEDEQLKRDSLEDYCRFMNPLNERLWSFGAMEPGCTLAI